MKQTLQSRTNQQIQPKFSFLISVLPLERVRGLKSKNKIILSFAIMVLFCLSAIQLSAQVSGTVWQDLPLNGTTLNTYGVKDANELGVEGVTVTAYPGAITTITAANGTYSLATGAGDFRIEFTWPTKTWLQSSPDAAMQNTSAQFVTGPVANVNFGLHNPVHYADDEADIGMTFQVNNDGTDLSLFTVRVLRNADIPGVTNSGIPTDGISDNNGPQTAQPIKGDKVGFINQTGSVWGLAFNKETEDVYVSAAVRRFTAMGPSGTGAIYKIDNANNVTLLTTVVGTGVIAANGARNLSADPNIPSHDPVFDEVGRVGLGDLDISADGKMLYTINTNTNEFVEIEIANPATQNTYAIGNPFGGGCPVADVTSWGIGQHEGKVYVGSVCTSNTTAGAYVSEFDGAVFTPFHQIPLDMDGETSHNTLHFGLNLQPKRWRTWITNVTDLFDHPNNILTGRTSFPAPILSDIEFDENKGMVLGFADRTAMQAGWLNYSPDPADNFNYYHDASGEILRVCEVGGNYFNEGHANCPQNPAAPAGATTTQYPEYFGGDEWHDTHYENSLGGLAYQQGSERILTFAFDPIDNGYDGIPLNTNVTNSGVRWLNTITGDGTSGIRLAGGGSGTTMQRSYMGKAGGIGDVEYLNAPAPIEIGNLVWDDTNGNGIQDAGEPGLPNVAVELRKGVALVATATTDANGNYIFSNDPNGMDSPSHKYNLTMLVANMEYTLTVPTTFGGDNLATANTGEGSNTDINDSDANTGTGVATVLATDIPVLGANNHTFDFGYSALPPCPPARCGTVGVVKN